MTRKDFNREGDEPVTPDPPSPTTQQPDTDADDEFEESTDRDIPAGEDVNPGAGTTEPPS